METLKTVIVATDFGESSAAAVAYAKTVAREARAALRVVHVAEDTTVTYYTIDGGALNIDRFQREVEDEARQELAATLTEDERRELGAETVLLTSTTTSEALVDYARDAKADLLVLGTHGRRGISRFFLGSVAERVVRTAECPVLIVRDEFDEKVCTDGSACRSTMPTSIVVATDFGESSAAAVAYAKVVARQFHAALRVVHMAEDISIPHYTVDTGKRAIDPLQQRVEEAARRDLAFQLTDEERTELSAETVLLTSGTVAATLVAYVRDIRADLIVVGTHGRTRLARFFLGSVAERVVRTADCPVLTVRQSAATADLRIPRPARTRTVVAGAA